MSVTKYFDRFGACLFTAALGLLLIAGTAFSQPAKLGIVKYTAPAGWTKTQTQPNVIAFSSVNQSTGAFCIITLYGATPGTGTAESDFTREWNKLVVANMKTDGSPSTETASENGWTAIGGGTGVDVQGTKGIAYLTVVSGSGQTVSILAVLTDQSYLPQAQAFIAAIEMDKIVAAAKPTTVASPPALDSDGNLVIPEPARDLTIADLVGNWGDNPGRIATTYVDRSDGSYAGTDSLHFTSKWKIEANGRYTNDFFEVRNGKKLSDVTVGTITIVGRLISIKHGRSTAKYVVRGWLELPTMTILKVAGPWYDAQEIPERTFTDFSPDSRFMLANKWVRTN